MSSPEPGPASEIPSTPLGVYFAAVDAGSFDAAVEVFAESCVYIRPPLPTSSGQGDGGLLTIVGKAGVLRFLEERGPLPLNHTIQFGIVDHFQCFVEGTSNRLEPGAGEGSVFMAHGVLNAEGLIERFLAVSTVLDAAKTS